MVLVLSFGHLITDINQGALPAILPFLISEYGLSYSAGATIIFAANSSSAVIQPLFGTIADRVSKNWLLPVAVLMAGLGIGSIGLVADYYQIIILTIISGIGIAAFHPQAARLVNFAAGDKKGTSMSLFGLGGILGFAIGPIIATTAMLTAGLRGTVVLIIPALVTFLILVGGLKRFNSLEAGNHHSVKHGQSQRKEDRWLAFSLLSLIIMGRSTIFFGINTFIPLYWTGHFNRTMAEGGIALSTLVISGVFGNLAGGWISDRFGFKRIIIIGFLGLTVLLPIFIMIDNPSIALIFLVPIGFMLTATYSPTIVLGQNYLPNHVGFSSGVTLGLSVAFGGIMAPFIGMVGDHKGIWWALAVLTLFPLLNALLSTALPESRKTVGVSD